MRLKHLKILYQKWAIQWVQPIVETLHAILSAILKTFVNKMEPSFSQAEGNTENVLKAENRRYLKVFSPFSRQTNPNGYKLFNEGDSTASKLAANHQLEQRLEESAREIQSLQQQLKQEVLDRHQLEAELIKARQEIEQAKAELEEQVCQRTACLQQALAELADEIADRKQIEVALQRSEERFRNLVETTNDLVWEIDERGTYTYLSPQVYNILGYTPEELLGKTPFDFMSAAEAWRVCNLMAAMTTQKASFSNLEKTKIRKDGHLVILETGGVPIIDAEGVVRGYRGINRDITARKQAENNLRQQALAFETVYESIIITDWEGRITDWNPGSSRMFGYSKEEVLGKTIGFLYATQLDVKNSLEQHILEEINLRDRWMGEINFFGKDGHEGICETVFVPVYGNEGEKLGIVGINHDISARKVTEAEMHDSLEAEKELREMKSQFISMVSHDFRNPLATILTSTELLETFGEKLSGERKLNHLHKIQAAVKNMTQLLEDVLFIGKAESGSMEFKPETLDLKYFCQEILEEVKQAVAQEHELFFEYEEEIHHPQMDKKLLRKILMNLLSNALKYSPDGGKVCFRVSCGKETTIIRIKDRGIGIPEADRERLFQSFHRASNVGNICGTGLGMAIVKNAIELHQGEIAFETEVGVGTEFTLRIPTNAVLEKLE